MFEWANPSTPEFLSPTAAHRCRVRICVSSSQTIRLCCLLCYTRQSLVPLTRSPNSLFSTTTLCAIPCLYALFGTSLCLVQSCCMIVLCLPIRILCYYCFASRQRCSDNLLSKNFITTSIYLQFPSFLLHPQHTTLRLPCGKYPLQSPSLLTRNRIFQDVEVDVQRAAFIC